MLVLTRKFGEQIIIGSNITLTVCLIEENFVGLGFEAPREVTILRAEVLERAKQIPDRKSET